MDTSTQSPLRVPLMRAIAVSGGLPIILSARAGVLTASTQDGYTEAVAAEITTAFAGVKPADWLAASEMDQLGWVTFTESSYAAYAASGYAPATDPYC